MIRHEPVLPSEDIYPIDDWRLIESRLSLQKIAQTETIFATANGYLGMRGAFEEGGPAGQHGTFINGFYESWPIPYGESAFGFARRGQTMVNVPDGKIIRLYVDDEPFDLESAFVQRYERVLRPACRPTTLVARAACRRHPRATPRAAGRCPGRGP